MKKSSRLKWISRLDLTSRNKKSMGRNIPFTAQFSLNNGFCCTRRASRSGGTSCTCCTRSASRSNGASCPGCARSAGRSNGPSCACSARRSGRAGCPGCSCCTGRPGRSSWPGSTTAAYYITWLTWLARITTSVYSHLRFEICHYATLIFL